VTTRARMATTGRKSDASRSNTPARVHCGAWWRGGVAGVARAQQSAMPVVGWLTAVPLNATPAMPFFKQGLADLGYVEGQNIRFEYRSTGFKNELFPLLAKELVEARVSLIAAVSGLPAVLAAKAATATIPIVFIVPTDPVGLGLVASLSRPGGNLTGVTVMNPSGLVKQIELMHELVPNAAPIAVLVDPSVEAADLEESAQIAARTLDRRVIVTPATSVGDFETALAAVDLPGERFDTTKTHSRHCKEGSRQGPGCWLLSK
jgi:putative tryptophan/tyrosine transport system substrate-binding protein